MKFINRQREMERLDRLVQLPDGGMAVVWGRRRVGKTRLLLEWTHKHKGIYFTADESAASVQRKYFALALSEVLPGFASVEYPDWSSFFTRLARDAKGIHWRGPLVIDELPYLISSSPEIPSILQKFIDREAKEARLILALCGSSQRMMQGAILDASAPLYGRATELIKLSPISIGYMGQSLGITEPQEIVKSYTIWGGIPRYWELVANSKGSFYENIDRLVLDPMGPLNEEPQRLLLEESPPAVSLRPILDSIGLGAHRLSEIGAKIGQPATSLVRPIQRLLEMDLISREIPYGTEEHNSKRALYKIKDPFMRFWFQVVAPRRSLFAQAPSTLRKKWLEEDLRPLFAYQWEELCRSAVSHLSLHWEEPFEQAGRYWHGQGPEWDIISQSISRRVFLSGEAKWITKAPTSQWVEQTLHVLNTKGIPPIPRPKQQRVQYVLFIPEKSKHLKLPENAKVFDAHDIIKAFMH